VGIRGSLKGFHPFITHLPPLLKRRGVHPEGFSLKGTQGVRIVRGKPPGVGTSEAR